MYPLVRKKKKAIVCIDIFFKNNYVTLDQNRQYSSSAGWRPRGRTSIYPRAVYTCQRSCITLESKLFYRLYKDHVTMRMLLYRKLVMSCIITNYSTSSFKKKKSTSKLQPQGITLGSKFYALVGVKDPSLAQSNQTPNSAKPEITERRDTFRQQR